MEPRGVGHGVRAVRRRRRADPVRAAAADDRAAAAAGRPTPLPHPLARRQRARDRGERDADRRPASGTRGAMAFFWPRVEERGEREGQGLGRARVGARRRGPRPTRYGGNTSCVQVTLSDGTILVLDAGTASATSASRWPSEPARIHILLTHLHLDHIQGLMFFAPAFRPQTEIDDLGPGGARGVARGPDRPLHLRAAVAGRGARAALRRLVPRGAARPSGRSARRGSTRRARSPTAARRSATGSPRATRRSATSRTTSRRSARRSTSCEPEWISGFELAQGAIAADPRLPVHRRRVPRPPRLGPLARCRTRSTFARRVDARAAAALPPRPAAHRRLPRRLHGTALERWDELGGTRRRSSWPSSAARSSSARLET